jgi:hypothetical protein
MATKLEILEGIQNDRQGFAYFKPKDYKKLLSDGLIEVNEVMVTELGEHACRLTEKGIEYMKSINGTSGTSAATAKEKAMTQSFAILDVPIPTTRRKGGAGRPSKYPFDGLEVGKSFFVPCSVDQPDPAKSLGSVVTSANRRYATETSETKTNRKGEQVPKLAYTRRFVVRPYTHEGVEGALVCREK